MRYKEFRVDEIFSKFVQGAISGGDLGWPLRRGRGVLPRGLGPHRGKPKTTGRPVWIRAGIPRS